MDEVAFGEHLVAHGVVSEAALSRAAEHQAIVGGALCTVLLELGLADEDRLLGTVGDFKRAQTVSAAQLRTIDPEVAALVSPRMAARHQLVPFRKDGKKLAVAMLDPGDLLVEDELALLTGCMITSYAALEVRLHQAMERHYGIQRTPLEVSVCTRLAGGRQRPAPVRAEVPAAEARPVQVSRPEPAPAPPAVQPAPPVERRIRPAVSELEITDEDLALFPSLAAAHEAEAVAPAAESPRQVAVELVPPSVPHLDHAAAPPPPPRSLSPGERLARSALALQAAEMRDDIGDALLGFCAPYLNRRLLLALRKDTVIGWRGEGDGVDEMLVRAIAIPLADPSVFVGLVQGQSFWLGPLPPMARNIDLVLALGGTEPAACVILPVTLRDKTICFLYGDNLAKGVGGVPMGELRRLVAKASIAFQVYILKNKIRTL